MQKFLLGVFMSVAAAAGIAVIAVGIGVSASDFVRASSPRVVVVAYRHVAQRPTSEVASPCVPKASGISAPVGGLGTEVVPQLPKASRLSYSGNGYSQYLAPGETSTILNFYAQELAARCWQVAAITQGQAVWQKDTASLKIGVEEDPLGGRSTVNYQLAYGEVLGVSFRAAQTACGDGMYWCESSHACMPSGSTCGTTGGTTGGTTCPAPPSGCTSGYTYDGSGCATGCATPAVSCSGSYTQGTATYSCNYTTCPSGCTFGSDNCANGCMASGGGGGTTAGTCTGGYTGSGATWTCNYTTCPSGCSYDNVGCASGCTTTGGGQTGGTTCSGEFQQTGATYASCNYTRCPNGCQWTNGCPSGCSVTPTCSGEFQAPGTTSPSCNYSRCSFQCTYGADGCPNGCMSSSGGSCPSGQYNCNGACISNTTSCGSTGSTGCSSGYFWCSSSNACIPTGTTCGATSSSCGSGYYWCPSSSSCKQNFETCPTSGTGGTSCTAGQITCWSSTGSSYCYSGTTCPATTGGTGGPTSCASPQVLCTGGGSSWCQSAPCPASCPSGQYNCNGVCKPTSDTNCPAGGGGTTTCGSGQITCWSSTGSSYCYAGTTCPATGGGTYAGDANSCPGFSYSRWDSQGRRYCQLNNERRCDYNYPSYLTNGVNYKVENCPAETGGGTSGSCGSGYYWCGSTSSCKPVSDTNCSSTGTTWPTTQSDCTARGYKWCQGTDSGACYFPGQTCPQSCPSGQYWCQSSSSCKPNSDTNCSAGGGAVTCPSGQRWCWTTTSCVASTAACGDGATCPSDQYWCGTTQRCMSYNESCSSGSSCGSGSYWCNGGCIPNGSTCSNSPGGTACSSDKYWCSVTNSCIPFGSSCGSGTDTTTCPAGQNRCTSQYGGSWCQAGQCPPTCTANEFYCSSSNTCKRYGEDCPPSGGCASGMVWCPTTYSCQAAGTPCESSCPAGYFKCWAENGVCKPNGSSCGAGGDGQWPQPVVGSTCPSPKYWCDAQCVEPGTPCHGIVPPRGDGRDIVYRPPQECERGTYFCPSRGARGECIPYSDQCVVYRGEVRQYPNTPGGPYPPGPYPTGQYGDGQYPGGPYSGQYQPPTLSEEQITQIEHQQFEQAVSRLPDFEKEFASAKRQFKQMENKLKSCKFEMPKPLVEALAAFERALPKLKTATDFTEVEALMREIWFDAGPEMERWAEDMPELLRQCELKKRERRIRNDVRTIERDFTTLKRRAGKRTEFAELVTEAETNVVALKAAMEKMFAQLGKGDVDAVAEISDELWERIEAARTANDTLRGALNARSDLARMDRELRLRKTEIDRFAKAGKDVAEARAAYDETKAKVDELRAAVRERADIETIVDLMEEIHDLWDRLLAALEDLRGYGAYEINIEIKDRIDFELDDSFQRPEYDVPSTPPVGAGADGASAGGTPVAEPASSPTPLPSPSPSPTPSCPACQAWNEGKAACAPTPFAKLPGTANDWCDEYGGKVGLRAGQTFVTQVVNGQVKGAICGNYDCSDGIETATNCPTDCTLKTRQY